MSPNELERRLDGISDNSVSNLNSIMDEHKKNGDILDYFITEERNKHYNNISVLFNGRIWKHYMV